MPYITQAQITAIIPLPVLTDALDDEGTGEFDGDLLAQIIQNASDRADGLVASRYAVPFVNPPKNVIRATLCFAIEAIYARREVPDAKMPPEVKEAKTWEEYLTDAGRGRKQLDANQPIVLQADAGGDVYIPGRIPVPQQGGPLTGDTPSTQAPTVQ